MLRTKVQRTLAALSLAVAATAVPLMTATDAQALPSDCRAYLKNRGYIVGDGVANACNHDVYWQTGFCIAKLVNLRVTTSHAQEACRLAKLD